MSRYNMGYLSLSCSGVIPGSGYIGSPTNEDQGFFRIAIKKSLQKKMNLCIYRCEFSIWLGSPQNKDEGEVGFSQKAKEKSVRHKEAREKIP